MKPHYLLVCLSALILASACQKEETNDENSNNGLVVPTVYDSTAYTAHIQQISYLSTNFDVIVTEVKKGRSAQGTVSADALNTSYTANNPSLQAITTAVHNSILVGNTGWFAEAERASGKTYHPDSTSTDGGAFGGYLFDENGQEPEQIIEKGMFGATLINQAMVLLQNPTLENIDRALFIIGANPQFKSSNNTTLHGNAADRYMATYVARRDKNDGSGFYSQMKFNFLKLQAAVKGGSAYHADRDAAIAALYRIWEEANFATVINYCHTSITNLSLTSLTDAQKAATLHAIGECIGFTLGWKSLPKKRITETQIDEILVLLNSPTDGSGKPSVFITDRINQISKLQSIITKLQGIYGFSNAQVEDFRKNWIVEQNR